MNCKLAQEQIKEKLASADSGLPPKVRAHRDGCRDCQAFYEKERNLHSALQRGLGNIMNPVIPASLVPRVRVRLEEPSVRQSAWILRLVFATAALAILLVFSGYLNRKPEDQPQATHLEVVSGSNSGSTLPALPARNTLVASKPRTEKHANPRSSSHALPEVIISVEERQAFARFVARFPEDRHVAVALVRPASVEADSPIEIALLDLGSVEVKPLESETSEWHVHLGRVQETEP
jgi:hypothetical protein